MSTAKTTGRNSREKYYLISESDIDMILTIILNDHDNMPGNEYAYVMGILENLTPAEDSDSRGE